MRRATASPATSLRAPARPRRGGDPRAAVLHLVAALPAARWNGRNELRRDVVDLRAGAH